MRYVFSDIHHTGSDTVRGGGFEAELNETAKQARHAALRERVDPNCTVNARFGITDT